jgi:hypothetical protein
VSRLLVQHPRPLADRQPDARSVPDGAVENFARLVRYASRLAALTERPMQLIPQTTTSETVGRDEDKK